uniref:Uncharacterized protein n=1 Tax=Opuntia streptacantha TaxID=393608 RepID=A0A7C9AE76_OPUST
MNRIPGPTWPYSCVLPVLAGCSYGQGPTLLAHFCFCLQFLILCLHPTRNIMTYANNYCIGNTPKIISDYLLDHIGSQTDDSLSTEKEWTTDKIQVTSLQ